MIRGTRCKTNLSLVRARYTVYPRLNRWYPFDSRQEAERRWYVLITRRVGMRRPVRVLHASRSVRTARDHVSSPSSYAFFLHLPPLLLLAPFILPLLSRVRDSSFVHNESSSLVVTSLSVFSSLPLFFPFPLLLESFYLYQASFIAVISKKRERETRISISDREESEMKNSYLASFALPFALSSCFIIHEPWTRTGSRSLASYDKEVNGSEKSPVRLFEFSERRDREGSSTPAFSTGLFLIRSSFSLSLVCPFEIPSTTRPRRYLS